MTSIIVYRTNLLLLIVITMTLTRTTPTPTPILQGEIIRMFGRTTEQRKAIVKGTDIRTGEEINHPIVRQNECVTKGVTTPARSGRCRQVGNVGRNE